MTPTLFPWKRALLVLLICTGPLAAQDEQAPTKDAYEQDPAAKIKFVTGGPRDHTPPGDLSDVARFVATFETPVIEDESAWSPWGSQIPKSLPRAMWRAVESAAAQASLRSDECNLTAYRGRHARQHIRHETVRGKEPGYAVERWSVYACDEDMARVLTQAFIRAYYQKRVERLAVLRRDLLRLGEMAERLREAPGEDEAQSEEACAALRELGEETLTEKLVDQTVARLTQEKRLAEIDRAGIEARLDAVAQRMAETQGRTRGRASTPEEVGLLSQLGRIQVELEIDLVGALARLDKIAKEIGLLKGGRGCEAALKKVRRYRQSIKHHNEIIAETEQRIKETEAALELEILDNRVVISPIVCEDDSEKP